MEWSAEPDMLDGIVSANGLRLVLGSCAYRFGVLHIWQGNAVRLASLSASRAPSIAGEGGGRRHYGRRRHWGRDARYREQKQADATENMAK
jgi:hypothetical protein